MIALGTKAELEDVQSALKDVAAGLRGKIVVVTIDVKEHAQVAEYFGVEAEAAGLTVFGFKAEKGTKYLMEGEVTSATLGEFTAKLLDGKLQPHLKSEPTPETNDGPVTIVTGNTFDEIVLAEDKDVLLEIYAPWCGHCKQLEPIYKKLGKKFKNTDSVVIAKMDGTANEVELLNIEGFPTIMFFPAGEDSEAMDYDGERTVKGFTKFLKKNAAIPFKLEKKSKDQAEESAEETGYAKDEL